MTPRPPPTPVQPSPSPRAAAHPPPLKLDLLSCQPQPTVRNAHLIVSPHARAVLSHVQAHAHTLVPRLSSLSLSLSLSLSRLSVFYHTLAAARCAPHALKSRLHD